MPTLRIRRPILTRNQPYNFFSFFYYRELLFHYALKVNKNNHQIGAIRFYNKIIVKVPTCLCDIFTGGHENFLLTSSSIFISDAI